MCISVCVHACMWPVKLAISNILGVGIISSRELSTSGSSNQTGKAAVPLTSDPSLQPLVSLLLPSILTSKRTENLTIRKLHWLSSTSQTKENVQKSKGNMVDRNSCGGIREDLFAGVAHGTDITSHRPYPGCVCSCSCSTNKHKLTLSS